MTEKLTAVFAILFDDKGKIRQSASSSDTCPAAGFGDKQWQGRRAKTACVTDFVAKHFPYGVKEAVDGEVAGKLVDRLLREHGWRLEFMYHGYEEGDQ